MSSDDNNSIIPEAIMAYGGYKVLDSHKDSRALFSKLPGTQTFQNQLTRSSGFTAYSKTNQSVGMSAISQIMALEEASPLHVLRTFQISNLLQPFTKIAEVDQQIHITGQSVRGQQAFYEALLKQNEKELNRRIKRLLQADDLKRGMIFQNNKLYGVDAQGAINKSDVILEDARLVLASQKNGQINSQNHILRKYSEGIKGNLDFRQAINDPLMVIGSSKKNTLGKQLNAYLKLGMEMGYKTLDNPIAGFEELVTGLGGEVTGLTKTKFWQKAKALSNIQLGTGGVYDIGHVDSLKRVAKNMTIKAGGAYLGYQLLDSGARMLSGPNSDFQQGLISGIGGIYADARIGFAKIFSDRFQDYRNNQEAAAPGSTDLLTLLGMPLGGALMGAQAAYFGRIGRMAAKGQEAAAAKYSVESSSKLLSNTVGLFKPMTIMKRNAVVGGLMGAATVLPFLPGALIGASSQELEDRYSGKKEQEVRSNRWWLMGGNSIKGDHVKYSQQNWFARAKSEAKTKAVYGDAETKKSLNPLLHPISYLRDPYKFEKMTDSYMPAPIWGMEVGVGSFLGKFYERTLGQIIKPDVLNPRIKLEQDTREKEIGKIKNTDKVAGVSIDSAITQFRAKNLTTEQPDMEEIKQQVLEKNSRMFNSDEYDRSLQQVVEKVEGLKNTDSTKVVDLNNYDINVEDADTIKLTKKGAGGLFGKDSKPISIRLAGIDAPESADHEAGDAPKHVFHQEQEFNKESTAMLKDMLSKQKTLQLVVNTKDSTYGRQLGVIVGDNNTNINLDLVKKGAVTALPWDGGSDIMSKGSLNQAQKQAMKNNEGLWQGKRYKAEYLFGELTEGPLTHNTLTNIKKLAEDPNLAALASYLKNIEGSKGELSAEDVKTVSSLASSYLANKEKNKNIRDYQNTLGMSVKKSTDMSDATVSAALSFNSKVSVNSSFGGDNSLAQVKDSPVYTPELQNIQLAYQSLSDFVGIKGWAFSMGVDALAEGASAIKEQQLAKSGEATNVARAFKGMNLGDVAGLGEFQRKIMGTSKGALPDTTNMMSNQMPDWLPKNGSRYYIDFSKGNPYAAVENGEERLPGAGFAALNPEVKGIDPNNYPLIYQYKILSDVAKGSAEQYRMRKKLLDEYKAGNLGKREEDILVETLDKEVARENKRIFKDDFEKQSTSRGPLGALQGGLWDRLSAISNSNPLEMLTPWRPFSKFMHQRTAIEDYEATQLGGSDTAIWTNPYSHFIKPALNKTRLLMDDTFKPKETQEKENINEYFDKLGMLKGMLSGNNRDAFNTVVHSTSSGLNTKEKVLRFKASLQDDQKVYFNNFSKERDESKRSRILEMLPTDVARGYAQIWKNLDIATNAKNTGGSIQDALKTDFLKTTAELKNRLVKDFKLTKQQSFQIDKDIEKNRDMYANQGYSKKERRQMAEGDLIRTRAAQKEAYAYVNEATGAPKGFFAGWDPRLTIKDIKIKTLATGKEDLRRFGFWQGDEDRMNSIQALDRDEQVVTQLEFIKEEIKQERNTKELIANALFKKGFNAGHIKINDSEFNSIVIRQNSQGG